MGTVYWITGLAGAGKTTIGKLFYEKIRQQKENVVFLDGDLLREVFCNDLGYSAADRKISAMRNSRICKLLADQGIDVVCATISMFHECRQWNRDNIKNYREIYIKVPVDVLMLRDQKKLYSQTLAGKNFNVAGLDLPVEVPVNADVILENDGTLEPCVVVEQLWQRVFGKK